MTLEYSSIFVVIGKIRISFGATPKLSSENNNEQLFGGNSEPSSIKNLKLTPPLKDFE